MKHEFNTRKLGDRIQLRAWIIWHYFTGPYRGCSCSKCFHDRRRRVTAAEFYEDRIRLAKVEDRVRKLEGMWP